MNDKPTVDSDPGPATCQACGDVYTKIGRANRGVCPDCWNDQHTCPECGSVKQSHQDVCEDCACDHPAAYVDKSGDWDVQRCVVCDEVVNKGNIGPDNPMYVPLYGENE